MTDAEKIIRFMHYSEKLKTELRYASKSDGNRESVADHCWRLSLLLVLALPKLRLEADPLKVLKMAIIHDLVEIEAKDLPVLQTVNNGERQKMKQEQEMVAINSIKTMLGETGVEIYELFMEFEQGKSNEAKVVKALDYLEGQMQFLHEDITKFTESDQEPIRKLLEKTATACNVDPFLAELDQITLEDRQNRIKH